MLQSLIDLVLDTGFFYVDWRMIVMWGVVCVLLYLAVFKQFEPLLLVPIAFGALLANLPTEGVVNKPASYLIAPAEGTVVEMFVGKSDKVFVPRVVRQIPAKVSDIVSSEATGAKRWSQNILRCLKKSLPRRRARILLKKQKAFLTWCR